MRSRLPLLLASLLVINLALLAAVTTTCESCKQRAAKLASR